MVCIHHILTICSSYCLLPHTHTHTQKAAVKLNQIWLLEIYLLSTSIVLPLHQSLCLRRLTCKNYINIFLCHLFPGRIQLTTNPGRAMMIERRRIQGTYYFVWSSQVDFVTLFMFTVPLKEAISVGFSSWGFFPHPIGSGGGKSPIYWTLPVGSPALYSSPFNCLFSNSLQIILKCWDLGLFRPLWNCKKIDILLLLLLLILFFFLILLIYLWLCWVLFSVRGLPPAAASGGHSPSRCVGPSPPRPLPLRSTGSRRAGSAIVAHGPSRSAARGILPDQGSNPRPPHRQADSQPLRHQGSPYWFFNWSKSKANQYH